MRNPFKTLFKALVKLGTLAAGMGLVAIGPDTGFVGRATAQDIAFVVHGPASDPFWTAVKNGAEAAAKDRGATVAFDASKIFDPGEMSRAIDAAAEKKPDGLVVSIPDADALGSAIKRAVAAGIPVISINTGAAASKRLGALLHVGQDDYTAGKAAGARLSALGGKFAICVAHDAGKAALGQRCGGFAAGFGGIVEEIAVSDNKSATVQSRIRAALELNPDIDTIIALEATAVGVPALAAVADSKDIGRVGEVNVGAFGAPPRFLQSVLAGDAVFAIDPQPFLQGYLPVAFLALYSQYGLIPGGNAPSGPNLITADKAKRAIELGAQGIR